MQEQDMLSRQVGYFPHQGSSRQSEKETPSLGTQVVHVCSCKEETTGSHRSEFGLSGTPPSGTLNVFVMTPYQLATIIVWYQFVFFSGAAHLMVIKHFPEIRMMTSLQKSVLDRGSGRGSSCCDSTLVLVVDVVKLRSRRNKALEGLMHLVRFIKVVRVLLVCHDHSMLGRFEKRLV